MLLVVGRSRYAGDNAEDRAESVVHPINRIGHPTAAPSVPPFAFQNGIEQSARPRRGRHRVQGPGVGLFLQRAFPQKIPDIIFAGQSAVPLVAKLRFMFFFGGFHPPDGDIGAGDFVPPAIQAPRESVV